MSIRLQPHALELLLDISNGQISVPYLSPKTINELDVYDDYYNVFSQALYHPTHAHKNTKPNCYIITYLCGILYILSPLCFASFFPEYNE